MLGIQGFRLPRFSAEGSDPGFGFTRRFMGSYKWGYKSSNKGNYKYRYLTYNTPFITIYNYP